MPQEAVWVTYGGQTARKSLNRSDRDFCCCKEKIYLYNSHSLLA